MIGLDTNVVVRYITQDDDIQSHVASRLFDSLSPAEPGYISLVALIETVWVLRSYYGASRQQIHGVIERLLRARGVAVERSDLVWLALSDYARGKADFSDYLVERSGRSAGCEYTVTFDREAAIEAGMKLLR